MRLILLRFYLYFCRDNILTMVVITTKFKVQTHYGHLKERLRGANIC